MVIVGGYVGWYGWYELRVYAGDTADDPIISAASEIQDRLARWVDQLGPMAFTTALVALVLVAIAARVRSGRRSSPSASVTSSRRPE